MADSALTQLGIGGILVILVLREVFSFLRERRNNRSGVDLPRLAQQINELHQWHSVVDSEGVRVWYVRRSLEEAIRELSANIRAQTKLLEQLVLEQRETRRDLERLKDAS